MTDPDAEGGRWQPPGHWPPPGGGSVPPAPLAGPPPSGWSSPAPGGPPPPAGPAYPPQGPAQRTPWSQLPPEQLIRMNRPGVVPLAPLALSDIFDGALKTMRRNPEATVGLALIVMLVTMVPSAIVSVLLLRAVRLSLTDALTVTTLVPLFFTWLATMALSGFVIYVVSEAALGDKVGIAQTWRQVRGRLPALAGTVVLTTLALLLVVAVPVALMVMTTRASEAGAVLALLLVLAMLPLVLWLVARLTLAPAAVVLEQCGPARGLSRSWQLTRGKAAWRVLGITLLAGLLTAIFAAIVGTPIQWLVTPLLQGSGMELTDTLATATLIDHGIQIVTNALATPFSAGVTALLYLDQRIRREGLDVALIQAAQHRASGRL